MVRAFYRKLPHRKVPRQRHAAALVIALVWLWAVTLGMSVSAQQPFPARVPPARPPASAAPPAPQPHPKPARPTHQHVAPVAPGIIVPVVHRVGGWKLLTLLERYDLQAASQSTSEFVHTNVVAGYALGDRRYIVARLPQAEVEAIAREMPFSVKEVADEESNSLTIVSDRARQSVRFVGLDAITGLSLLENVTRTTPQRFAYYPSARPATPVAPPIPPAPPAPPAPPVPPSPFPGLSAAPPAVGARLRLYSPVELGKVGGANSPAVRLRIAATEAKVTRITSPVGGQGGRFVVRADYLPQTLNGAVAVNDTGALVGVVERIADGEAHIISGVDVNAAVRRVLERRASVPQPWLGARGQALAAIKIEKMIESGWRLAEAQRLLANQQGVLLTNVPPYTPAALADLRPGDIVTRIGEQPVRGVGDFSDLLAAAGGNATIEVTVERANEATRQLYVRLSESFDPARETERASRLARLAEVGGSIATLLQPLGLEIVTAPAKLRARLGAEEGLLVVSLREGGAAAASGLRQGDIIERANGRLLTETDAASILASASRTRVVFDIVRGGQRINITMNYPLRAQPTQK